MLKPRNYSKSCHANFTGNDGDIEGSGDTKMEDNIKDGDKILRALNSLDAETVVNRCSCSVHMQSRLDASCRTAAIP